MKSSRTVFGVLVLIVGVIFWSALGANVVRGSYQRDYLNLYTGGYLVRTGHLADLYDFKVQTATEDALVPALPLHFPFVRPPFYAAILAPFTLIPVGTAYPIWIAIQTLGMFTVWLWAWRRFGPEAMVYCAFFLPTSLGIAHGQDCMVLVLEMLGAWLLLEHRRPFLAGLVLALTLFKFHLFLLVPLAILVRRQWRLFGGYALGGSVLATISALMVGPAGVRGYIGLLTRKDLETLSPSPEMMVGMNSIAVNLGLDFTWAKAMLFALPVILVVRTALRADSDLRWFWTAILGSMMLSPHTYEYDVSSLLIPGLLGAFTAEDRFLRMASMAALVPIAYFCTVLGAPMAIAPSLAVAVFLVALSGVTLSASTLGLARAVQQPPSPDAC